jgi:hypothetical protein
MASNPRKRTRPARPAQRRAAKASRSKSRKPTRKTSRRPRRPTAPPAEVGRHRTPPALQRERRTLLDEPEAPSETPTIAETAHPGARLERSRGNPEGLTGGDLDASWEQAYASGDETPGGDNPTPDQDRVDDIGRALGVRYADEEELVGSDKIIERDRHRWELNPASAEDFGERIEPEGERIEPEEENDGEEDA